MGDEKLERLLRAGMEADEPPDDLVAARVASARARLDDELSDNGVSVDRGSKEDDDVSPVIELRSAPERPGRAPGVWRRVGLVGAAAAIIVAFVAVATRDDQGSQLTTAGPTEGSECVADVELATPGQFTVATNVFASRPWLIGDPSEGQGFGPAVMAAVAEQLGFAEDEVDWDQIGFQFGTRGGTRFHDVYVDAAPVTEALVQNVDLSEPYYDVDLALVALESSPVANATSVADVRGATLLAAETPVAPGRRVQAARSLVDSPDQVTAFPLSDDAQLDALAALSDGSADAMVINLPSAGALGRVSADDDPRLDRVADDLSVVATLPPTRSSEQLRMVLAQGSPLTRCVNLALSALRADGTLARLETEWLRDGGSVPTLTE